MGGGPIVPARRRLSALASSLRQRKVNLPQRNLTFLLFSLSSTSLLKMILNIATVWISAADFSLSITTATLPPRHRRSSMPENNDCYWTGRRAEIKEMKKSSWSRWHSSQSLIIENTHTFWRGLDIAVLCTLQPPSQNNISIEEIKAATRTLVLAVVRYEDNR